MNPNEDPTFRTRASLLQRLQENGDDRSWREFFDRYWRLIFSFARRAGLSEADAEDVVQEVMISLARNVKEFRYEPGRGSFKSWLLVVTKNRIIDIRRRQARWSERFEAMAESPTRAGEQEDHCDPNPSPLDRVWLEEWESHLLQSALAAVRGQVAEKQYLMYEMHVLQEVPLARVAANLQTSAMSVYLAKHRVGKRLRVELEKARERLDPR